MERALRIEGYRNIGFKDEKPHRERLVINTNERIQAWINYISSEEYLKNLKK